MTETQDKAHPSDSHRFDELLTTIRNALSQDAAADVRAAGTMACRAILDTLDPTSRAPGPQAPMFATQRPPAATPSLSAVVGAIGQIPREQILEILVGGLRSMLAKSGPAYLTRPMPNVRPTGNGS